MAIHKSSQAWVAPAAGYESVIPNPNHKLLDQIREVMIGLGGGGTKSPLDCL
jgi:hypothetical protein